MCPWSLNEQSKRKMFKKVSKKSVRVRQESDEEDQEDLNKEEFEKTRELQKLRKRAAGTNIETLGTGKRKNQEDDDPLGLKRGGMMDIKAMKNYKQKDDAYNVGTEFAKETHIRDEDDEMRKFIETEMSKVKGARPDPEPEQEERAEEFLSPEDQALLALPQHLTKSTFKKDQQMISAQMLTGIPEVDLGIDVKIQNIERTERAKKKLLEESKKIVDPNDISKMHNFVQHDRWKDIREIEMVRDDTERVKVQPQVKRPNTVNIYSQEDDLILKDSSLRGQASDEKALEKFKNNAPRH